MNLPASFALLLTFLCFSAGAKPNVVIFLADDAGWGDYSHSGNTQVRTPNIDSIAEAGVSLERFYVCPVCSPTRAEFLTGRYHPRGGVRGEHGGEVLGPFWTGQTCARAEWRQNREPSKTREER